MNRLAIGVVRGCKGQMKRSLILVGVILLLVAGRLSAQFGLAFFPVESYEIAPPNDGRMCGPTWDRATTPDIQPFVLNGEPWLLTRCDNGRLFVHRLGGLRDQAPPPTTTVLTPQEMAIWMARGVDFNRIESGTLTPDGSGRRFIHNGRGWTIQ